MNFRRISIIIAVVILIAAIFASRFISGQREESTPPPKKTELPKVAVSKIKNTTIQAPVHLTGKLIAPDKIEIFAEVSGLLQGGATRFKVGNSFQRGSVLLSIDSEETRLNIKAQKSSLLNTLTRMMPDMKLDYPEDFAKWKEYINEFSEDKPLAKYPEASNEQLRFYLISNNIYNQFYTIQGLESRLRKYQIIAPFNGVITESMINPGTLIRVGQKLGEISNNANYELEASLSLQDLRFLNLGDKVQLSSEDIQGQWTGTVQRISKKLNPQTQSLSVFIRVSGQELREGMFLKGTLAANPVEGVSSISRNLLLDANKVFVIKKGKLALKTVKPIRFTANQVLVRGLSDGELLLNESSKEFFEGMKVQAQ